MDFEDYSKRINFIKEIETFGNLPAGKQKSCSITIKNNDVVLHEIKKSKFAQINKKRYYFSDKIVSLPNHHPYFHEIVQFKQDKKQKTEAFLQEGKHKLIQMEKFAVEKNTRISIYRNILQQKSTFFHLHLLRRSVENNQTYKLFSNNRELHFEWILAMNFRYNGTFSYNILVVGQTGCGKTSLVQSLGKNKILGDGLLKVDWISKIDLTKNGEDKIKKCFEYTHVEFHYPDDVDNFNLLIETFQKETIDNDQETNNNDCIIFGENKKFDKLLLTEDVSALADKLNDFSNFLTVSRKFGYICQYIFHMIYLKKSIWQMILSQTKIFNIFPLSIQLSNKPKILTNNCDKDTINYIQVEISE